MQHDPRPLLDLVHEASFPVYGLADRPLDLSLCSYGEGSLGEEATLSSVTFTYSSPRYPEAREAFELSSSHASPRLAEDVKIVFALGDPSEGPLLDFDSPLFQRYGFTNQEQEQAGAPQVWEGQLSIAGDPFSATVRSWSKPRSLALFLLQSEKSVLSGSASGPAFQEVLTLLETLVVLNHRDDLLGQYQHEFQDR